MSLEMCHLLLTLKTIIRKRAQSCDRCSLEYFAMHGRFHSRRRTHRRAGSVTRIAFKYILTGFRINFFRNDFSRSVYYFVFVYS